MKYEINSTKTFRKWLDHIKDAATKRKLLARFDRISVGNFGDHKLIGSSLFELRFFFSGGYRVYYTIQNQTVVLLLVGGDKSSQRQDIKKAKRILNNLEK